MRPVERGFSTILMSLVVLLVVTLTSFITATHLTARQAAVASLYHQTMAFHAAQAGIDYAAVHLTENYDTLSDGQTVQVSLASDKHFTLTYTFVGNKDVINVQSYGYVTSPESDVVAEHVLRQTLRYHDGTNTVTGSFPLQSRGELAMRNNALIYNLTGGLYSARLGQGVEFKNNARTELSDGPGSTASEIGSDVLLNDSEIAGMSDLEMQQSFLGAPITDYQAEATTYDLPASSGVQSYNDDIHGMTNIGISITHSGGSARFKNNSWVGTDEDPVVLVVNLSSGAMFEVGNNADVYGKVVVNGGSAELSNNVYLKGDLIVEGDLEIGNNVIVEGDVIATGNVELNNNARVYGLLFTLGNVNMKNNAEVHGAVIAGGGEVTMRNNAKIIYDANNASVTVPGAAGTPGYGIVQGSWADF